MAIVVLILAAITLLFGPGDGDCIRSSVRHIDRFGEQVKRRKDNRVSQIGKPVRIVEIPDPVKVPDQMPSTPSPSPTPTAEPSEPCPTPQPSQP